MTYTPHPSARPHVPGFASLPPSHAEPAVLVPPVDAIRTGAEVVSGAHARWLAEQAARQELIHRLGIPTGPHPLYDEFATALAERAGFAYGFVNLFLDQQTFIGLHQPPAGSGYTVVGRTMSIEDGWCPHVVQRKKALPLPDVHASHRFSGNTVVDAVGIRAYFGVPLIPPGTGIVLGTVCVIDPDRREQSEAGRIQNEVKETGAEILRSLTVGAAAP